MAEVVGLSLAFVVESRCRDVPHEQYVASLEGLCGGGFHARAVVGAVEPPQVCASVGLRDARCTDDEVVVVGVDGVFVGTEVETHVVVARGFHGDGVVLCAVAYTRLSHSGGIARCGPVLCVEAVGSGILFTVFFQ